MNPAIVQRTINNSLYQQALASGLTPLQARILAGRLDETTAFAPQEVQNSTLSRLPAPTLLLNSNKAANRVADAIIAGEIIGLQFDYDVDGLTSGTLGYKILTEVFGHPANKLATFVGDRMVDGYGLSKSVAQSILDHQPKMNVVITADCGSSDQPRIAKLKAAEIDVIVTDHHQIPESGAPESAYAVINPQQDTCQYPDKTIAGCMVMFLTLCVVRQQLVESGHLPQSTPKLSPYLDLVGLGTVADAVSMASPVNRAVVNAGVKEMNKLYRPAWQAIAELAKINHFEAEHLGFQIGPRINARSRMGNPDIALNYLLSEDIGKATETLEVLESHNQERKLEEKRMLGIALEQAQAQVNRQSPLLVVYDDSFHPGIQGIVATRLVDRFGRPTFVLSPGKDPEELSGSGRSIETVNLHLLLKSIYERAPEIFVKFGGHKGAAGMTINKEKMKTFTTIATRQMKQIYPNVKLQPQIKTDGMLELEQINLFTIDEINGLKPYGRGFEEPVFSGDFIVEDMKAVGKGNAVHLSLWLKAGNKTVKSIWFNARESESHAMPVSYGQQIRCAYTLTANHFRGRTDVNLQIRTAQVI